MEGCGDYILKEKLRILKGKLFYWNTFIFGRLKLEVEENFSKINDPDDFLISCRIRESAAVTASRSEALRRTCLNLKIKENMLL